MEVCFFCQIFLQFYKNKVEGFPAKNSGSGSCLFNVNGGNKLVSFVCIPLLN